VVEPKSFVKTELGYAQAQCFLTKRTQIREQGQEKARITPEKQRGKKKMQTFSKRHPNKTQ